METLNCDGKDSLSQLLVNGCALNVKKKILWKSCTKLGFFQDGENDRLGVEMEAKDGGKRMVAVVKATKWAAQEALAAAVAEAIGVRCPKTRVLDASDEEYEELKCAVSDLLENDADMHERIVGEYLAPKQLLVMEAPVQAVPLKKLKDGLTVDMLFQLGFFVALDMLLDNEMSLPLGDLWSQGVNRERFLFRMELDGNVTTFGINQVFHHPNQKKTHDSYLQKLTSVLSTETDLVRALHATTTFLEQELGKPLIPGAAQIIGKGVRQCISRAQELSRADFSEMLSKIEAMVPNSGGQTVWLESLSKIDIDFMSDVLGVFRSCGVRKIQFERVEGAGALAGILSSARGTFESGEAQVEIFFDFDRTLTNGLAASAELPLEKRVRGGAHSVAALAGVAESGLPMHIITARSPRKVVVEQLIMALRGPQKEIGKFFLSPAQCQGESEPRTEETRFCGHQLAFATDAPLYASDYQKPAALAHALCHKYPQRDGENCNRDIFVLFVDDVAMNAHDVGTRLGQMLHEAGRLDLETRITVRSVWWDTFREDTGQSPSMAPELGKTEQSYQEFMITQLLDFGLSSAEVKRRRDLYAAENAASGRPKRESVALKVGKLKPSTAAQEHLARFLFGGGKKNDA